MTEPALVDSMYRCVGRRMSSLASRVSWLRRFLLVACVQTIHVSCPTSASRSTSETLHAPRRLKRPVGRHIRQFSKLSPE